MNETKVAHTPTKKELLDTIKVMRSEIHELLEDIYYKPGRSAGANWTSELSEIYTRLIEINQLASVEVEEAIAQAEGVKS